MRTRTRRAWGIRARCHDWYGVRVVWRLSFLVPLLILRAGCGGASDRIAAWENRGNYSRLVCLTADCLFFPPDPKSRDFQHLLIRALGESHDPSASPYLINVLHERERFGDLSDEAAYSLAQIGRPETFYVLEKAIATQRLSAEEAVTAMGILAVNGENARALLYVVRALESDGDANVRYAAARALYAVSRKQDRAMRGLRQAARTDPAMRVRVAAAWVLVDHGWKEYRAIFKDAAEDKDAKVRTEVAQDVPFQDETVPLLLRLLTDDDPEVAAAACERLENVFGEARETPGGLYADFSSSPSDVEARRVMAETYRKAWNASHRK